MALVDDLRYLIEYDILKVKRILRGLVAEMPRSFDVRILLGDAHLRALEFDGAMEQYRAACAIDPKSRVAMAKVALCQFYTGQYSAALEGFEALHGSGRDDVALVLAGLLLHRLGRPGEALARFAKLTAPGAEASVVLPFALQAEIRALREAGRIDDAELASRRLMAGLAARPGLAASELYQRASSYDFHEWSRIADKGQLAHLLARHGGGQPDLRFPRGFVLPDEREGLAAEPDGEGIWVIKPRGGQGGQAIRLTDRREEALAAEDVVVQRYIDPPYLVRGRKAHMRIYGLITSVDPLRFYVYDDGIVRLAPRPYGRGEGWLGQVDMHVTNTALHRNNPLLEVDQDARREDAGHVWSLKAYLRQIAADGHDAEAVFTAIARLVGRFVLLLRQDGFFARQAAAGPARSFGIKLFGMDVLLDGQLQPWLIEIQRSPAWGGTPMVNRINATLAETMVRMASSPLLGPDVPPGAAASIRADAAALARREETLEGWLRGGFVRILHDPAGERDAARGGREIAL